MINELNPAISDDERIDRINENLSLIQKKKGLTFGTDAYLLSAFAKSMPKDIAYDLGCGTGVTTLLCMARNKYKKMYAVEIQKAFSQLADKNAKLNGLDGVCEIVPEDVRSADKFPFAGSVSCVISNPPYMPKGSGKAPASDEMNQARREENGTIKDFCRAAAVLLKHGGLFYTVYRPDRLSELIYSLRENRLEVKKLVYVYPDIKSPPCLVLTESKKGASPSVKTARPLIIYRDGDLTKQRKYTEDMDRIYSEFSLDFLFEKQK